MVEVTNIRADGDGTPIRDESGWQHYAYRFDLVAGGQIIVGNAPFRQGMAHTVAPTADEILESLALDFQSIEGYTDWLDWADDLALLDSAATARKARDSFREIAARASLIIEAGDELPQVPQDA